MQRQPSSVGSLPEVIAFDHVSTSSDADFDQEMCWTSIENSSQTRVPDTGTNNHPGHDFYRWDFAESSSRSAHDETLLSSHNNPGSHLPLHDLNMNCEDDDDDDDDDDCKVLEYPHVLNSIGGPRIGQQPPFASSSSNPFGAPEIDGDGRRLSCKRKSPEGNFVGQPTEGGGGSTSNNNNFSSPEQVNPSLGLSFGQQVTSDGFPSLYASGTPSSSRRNFRLRINTSVSNTTTLTPESSNQSSSRLLLPSNNHLNLRSVSTASSNGNVESQPVSVRVPSFRPVSQSRWNGSTSLGNEASTSTSIPRSNIVEDYHPITVPPPSSSIQSIPNWGRNFDVSGNVALSAGSGSGSGSGSWVPYQSQSQNPHRLAEYVRRSLVSDDHLHPDLPPSEYFRRSLVSDDHLHPDPPPSSGPISQAGQAGRHSYSRSAMLLERRNNGALGIPYSLRSLNLAISGGEGGSSSRLVSEMQNVLDLVRRGEGLRFEDVMMLDQSVFFGVAADRYDRHRDMRLDVDNMSYEELLELEEHIGSVNTGLSEEFISKKLKQQNYSTSEIGEEKIEPCCICQEEYNNGEVLGLLECGHDFHMECINKWLMVKNICPICKTTGLIK